MPPSIRYRREGKSIEFDRVISFTDAVFAIALTLLVVEIGVPETIPGAGDDPAALLNALADKAPLIAAFFLGCLVIGSYWAAHHRFIARLGAVDRGFVALTVVYLTFVALLPFPTGVLGKFPENPISVIAFAVNMGAVSGMEAVLLAHAWRRRLLQDQFPEDVYRWALKMSLAPVLLFVASVPVAFMLSWLAVAVWFLALPLQMFWNRHRPVGTERYFA
jgi:uncharacterized membrane protein